MTLSSSYRGGVTVAFNTGATVSIAVRQVTNPSRVSLIRRSLGLENADAVLEARLINPKRAPAALKAGAKATFTWAGRAGVVTVEPYQSSLPTEWRDRYGDRILLSFSTDEA